MQHFSKERIFVSETEAIEVFTKIIRVGYIQRECSLEKVCHMSDILKLMTESQNVVWFCTDSFCDVHGMEPLFLLAIL